MKKYYISGLVVVIILAAGAIWAHQHQKPEIKQVKVGGLFALSGFAGFAGEASRDGFLMAIEDSGLNVQYVIEDFQSDHTKIATAANKLTAVDHVQAVIGPEWTEFGEVVAPISEQSHVVFISPWMTFEGKLLDSPYYFSATPSERNETRRLLEEISTRQQTNIALISSQSAWSNGYVEVLKDELKSRPELQIVEDMKVADTTNDFRSEIVKIKQRQPDAIYAVLATDNSQGVFSRQLQEMGVNTQVYIPFSRGGSQVLLKEFGTFLDGTIFPAPKAYKNAEVFNEKYEKRYGKKPGAISAATAYDMTTLVLNAIKDGATTSDEIKEYLNKVKNYEGYSNQIEFDARGQVEREEVELRQIRAGEAQVL